MNIRFMGLVVVLLSVLILPSTSLAVGLYGSADAGVKVNVGDNTTSSAHTDVNTDLGAGVSTTIKGEVNATSTGNAGGENRGLENALIHVTANDATNATAVITSLIGVHTSNDFVAYAKGKMQGDANLRDIEAATTSVSISYRVPAHLFGFIPLHITATAVADADGTVKVNYPWYHFLFSTPDSEVSTALAGHVKTSGDVNLTDAEKAQILEEVQTAFRIAVGVDTSGAVAQ